MTPTFQLARSQAESSSALGLVISYPLPCFCNCTTNVSISIDPKGPVTKCAVIFVFTLHCNEWTIFGATAETPFTKNRIDIKHRTVFHMSTLAVVMTGRIPALRDEIRDIPCRFISSKAINVVRKIDPHVRIIKALQSNTQARNAISGGGATKVPSARLIEHAGRQCSVTFIKRLRNRANHKCEVHRHLGVTRFPVRNGFIVSHGFSLATLRKAYHG